MYDWYIINMHLSKLIERNVIAFSLSLSPSSYPFYFFPWEKKKLLWILNCINYIVSVFLYSFSIFIAHIFRFDFILFYYTLYTYVQHSFILYLLLSVYQFIQVKIYTMTISLLVDFCIHMYIWLICVSQGRCVNCQ